jgi:branched-chain amino acid transport system substrate-binding protein
VTVKVRVTTLWIVFAALLGFAGVALWWQSSAGSMTVGLDAPLTQQRIFDPSEMDAARLYLEEHPDSRIRLVTAHYDIEPAESPAVFQQLLDQGARFLITTRPSSSMIPSIALFADEQRLLINTSATTLLLTGQDDFILRIMPDLQQEQNRMAELVATLPGRRLLLVQDSSNMGYTDPAFAVFTARLAAISDWQIEHYTLDFNDLNMTQLLPVLAEPVDALYILAGDFQTVMGNLAQQFHQRYPAAPIILAPWARSHAILKLSGSAIEQMQLISHFPARSEDTALDNYLHRFTKRFGYTPQFMAIKVRQALELYEQAFAQGHRTPAAVKAYLLANSPHVTSLGSIDFDAFGDTTGEFYLLHALRRELE